MPDQAKHPNLVELLPEPGGTGQASARLRLWRAIERDRRRRERRRFAARSVVLGVTLIVGFALTPNTVDPQRRALMGLADALADQKSSSSPWYERIERFEWISVDPPLAGGRADYAFGLPAVVETWFGSDGAMQTRTSYGAPVFLDESDAELFETADLYQSYPVGQVVESGVEEPFAPSYEHGPYPLLEEMTAHLIGTVGDRPESARFLDLVIDLLRQERSNPAHRAVIVRAVASVPGLKVDQVGDTLVVSIVYFIDGLGYERKVVLDRSNGGLISQQTERLGSGPGARFLIVSQTFSCGDDQATGAAGDILAGEPHPAMGAAALGC